jgi:predicted GNAT family N-acyltransferase
MISPFQVSCTTWGAHESVLTNLRHRVFVIEQGVPETLEVDGDDVDAVHVMAALPNDTVIGTGRLLADGHIGRIAVEAVYRRQGVGRAMLMTLIDMARQQDLVTVYLGALVPAIRFYQGMGFESEGEEFLDAGIPHQHMVLNLQRDGKDACIKECL